MVLPPGEFNDTIAEPLPVYTQCFIMTAVKVFHNVANKQIWLKTTQVTTNNTQLAVSCAT